MNKEQGGHHLLYYDAVWTSLEPTRLLREHPSLIVPMDRRVHELIHQQVELVPPLDIHTARRTNAEFRNDAPDNYIGAIYFLMGCIQKGLDHPKTKTLQVDNAWLTIQALEQQIPYVRDGQLKRSRR